MVLCLMLAVFTTNMRHIKSRFLTLFQAEILGLKLAFYLNLIDNQILLITLSEENVFTTGTNLEQWIMHISSFFLLYSILTA